MITIIVGNVLLLVWNAAVVSPAKKDKFTGLEQ